MFNFEVGSITAHNHAVRGLENNDLVMSLSD